MYVPPGLIIIVSFLGFGFLVSLASFMRRQKRDMRSSKLFLSHDEYQLSRLGETNANPRIPTNMTEKTSLLREQEVKKYTIIDNRLMDDGGGEKTK
jgi:hypothetical protein